jgi:hypothetical protein
MQKREGRAKKVSEKTGDRLKGKVGPETLAEGKSWRMQKEQGKREKLAQRNSKETKDI